MPEEPEIRSSFYPILQREQKASWKAKLATTSAQSLAGQSPAAVRMAGRLKSPPTRRAS